MKITSTLENNTLTLAVEGRLDTTTSPELEQTINDRIADVTSLIFDFSNLEYISSSGLRVLLKAQKKMNTVGEMKVLHPNELVTEVFEGTGFCDILTIEK